MKLADSYLFSYTLNPVPCFPKQPMRIAIGNDHRGYQLKGRLLVLLADAGHEVENVGSDSDERVDYPDFASLVGELVRQKKVDRGILICGSGIGMCIAANKVVGVRAANCSDEVGAEMSRRHNDANVLCLSADMLGEGAVNRIVNTWLRTDFEGGRHQRRVDKIIESETSTGDR